MDFAPHDPDTFLREFRRIGTGIYDAPDDFVIKLDADTRGPLFEPIDEKLWTACAGSSIVTHFTIDRIYEALQKSENCSHIWALFESFFAISRESKIEEMCVIGPGVYPVPSDLMIMRTNRQAAIGGYSYKLISRPLHSNCQRLFTLARGGQQIRFAEIYAGLWVLGAFKKSIFLEMRIIMRHWLRNKEFSITEEGMLTTLVLQLGQPVKIQGIARLVTGRVLQDKYIMTRVLPSGGFHWIVKCEASNIPNYWQEPRATLQELVNALC
ncbi:uncharacterized protein N7518_004193 [Penicillium psychrosexuale]|uniref:uncharacterized protein n=1 Tax=Penicillium psychrosexuale TaxID=1002107 RepID=UPI002545169F|nr:uncharacterized protein N7518_004193 [Penicillium psychrosexuale]KAJ5795653.1 hypothetical protein N7518_004193 [Penicillium psychrosexuale]